MQLSTPTETTPGLSPLRKAALMEKARALEASFLSEMLSHAGLGAEDGAFSGGIGEDQFASFLRDEQAKAIVAHGGIGLAEQCSIHWRGAIMDKVEPGAAQLLDLIHHAIRIADYAALPGLQDSLAHEMDRPDFTLDAAELGLVKRKAQRNATCILATQRGIKSARRRLTEIRDAASGLVTYDRAGKKAGFSESQNLAQRL